jgi:hypothetical protein
MKHFLTKLAGVFTRAGARPGPARRPRPTRPHLEGLEDRTAPAVLTINTLADNNPTPTLSLRQAWTPSAPAAPPP